MESIESQAPIQQIEPITSSTPVKYFLEQLHPKGGVSPQMVAAFLHNLMKEFNSIMQEAMAASKRASEKLKEAESISSS